MTVTVNTERKGVEIRWDPGDYDGQVQIFAVGAEGDVHNTAPSPNDGLAGLAYPSGFNGRSAIEIRKADGSGEVVDSGVINVTSGGGPNAEDASAEE